MWKSGICKLLKYSLKKEINHNSCRLLHFDFARNNCYIKKNDLNARTLWVSPKQITAFSDFDNLTSNGKPSMFAESSEIRTVEPNMVSVSSQTEVKIDFLKIARSEIHNIELRGKC